MSFKAAVLGLAVSTLVNEGCEDAKRAPLPENIFGVTFSPEQGIKISNAVRGAAENCIAGTFSRPEFEAEMAKFGEDTKMVNVHCESGSEATIIKGPSLCSFSYSTTDGKNYTSGKADCAAGY